jgi:hypothetical protein
VPLNRASGTTIKVRSQFGNHFVSVFADADGRVCHLAISSPGKFHNTAIRKLLDDLEAAANQAIREVSQS